MDLKEIKQIVDLMKRSGLTEFEIEEKDLKLRICRQGDGAGNGLVAAPVAVAAAPAAPAPAAAAVPAAPAAVEDSSMTLIKSPMVGTFYSAPNPDSKAFVEVGSKVQEDTAVCIIEAMKVMNEIQSEVKGTITEVLVENGEAVEYGQPLFKVKKA